MKLPRHRALLPRKVSESTKPGQLNSSLPRHGARARSWAEGHPGLLPMRRLTIYLAAAVQHPLCVPSHDDPHGCQSSRSSRALSWSRRSRLATPTGDQPAAAPELIDVRSGALTLRAQVWRPSGSGRFPAVLFNHGSYGTDDPLPPSGTRARSARCSRTTATCFSGCIARARECRAARDGRRRSNGPRASRERSGGPQSRAASAARAR